MSITWNTGLAAERARHNLKLNKKKAAGPKPQAASRKQQAASRKRRALDKTCAVGYYKIMFTREEFLKAWKILFDKKQIDVRGFNNMNKVLKFLNKEFDKAYDRKKV